MAEDKLIIGGKEFNSRFILGSGKYSMKLIEAATRDAGAEIITLAVRRTNTKDSGLYSKECHTSSKYERSKRCKRGSAYSQTCKRAWMR